MFSELPPFTFFNFAIKRVVEIDLSSWVNISQDITSGNKLPDFEYLGDDMYHLIEDPDKLRLFVNRPNEGIEIDLECVSHIQSTECCSTGLVRRRFLLFQANCMNLLILAVTSHQAIVCRIKYLRKYGRRLPA